MMRKKRLAARGDHESIDADIDDEGVLADGMIPDSRIVELIDELEASADDLKTSHEPLKPG